MAWLENGSACAILGQRPLWLACQVALVRLHLARGERSAAQKRLQTVTAQGQTAWGRTRRTAAALMQQMEEDRD